jgi:nitrogen regulatory protein PII
MMQLVRTGADRETITQTARTGKIVVYSLEQVVSSRTGETGVGAL